MFTIESRAGYVLDGIILKQANKCVCVVLQGVNKSRPVPAVPTVPESEPYPDAG